MGIVCMVAFLGFWLWLGVREDRRHFRKMADFRAGDSICTFARSLDYRRLDTNVIRAVYEELQSYFEPTVAKFPFRVSDDLEKDLIIDEEDLQDLGHIIADRCGRELNNCETNPYREKVHTVGDLIHFLCAQPKRDPLGPCA